jgi:hypothetical protein
MYLIAMRLMLSFVAGLQGLITVTVKGNFRFIRQAILMEGLN